ncbi:MAG: VOC family protein [Gemmatimonadota bacterium]|nr:MAG: VOC family protein [Gemmatimonadota bacterium]
MHHTGKFVWYDLLAHDVEGAKRFYGELFGWQFTTDPEGDSLYTVILRDGRPVAGIAHVERPELSQWLSWLSVDDVDRAVQYVRDRGGAVHRDARDLPDRGRYAIVSDPQGAPFVLVRSSTGDPADGEPAFNSWLWTELWTHDTEAAMAFYEGLVAYRREAFDAGLNREYHVMWVGDRPRAGVGRLQLEGVQPNWLPYIRVDDPAATVARVEALGGRVIIAPSEDARGGSLAVILDPSGGAVALQRWPLDEGGQR